MNAQIFYLREAQREMPDMIESALRAGVYRDLHVERVPVDDNFSYSSHHPVQEGFNAYFRLLKAGMLKVRNFAVAVKDDTDALVGYVGYAYWDYAYHTIEVFLELRYGEMASVLPAVAVMDRMVMVPSAMTKAFAGASRTFSWCLKPLDLGGVLLVDFTDLQAVEQASHRIGRQLKNEIGRLCAHHMVLRELQQADVVDLAALLNINKNYLATYRDELGLAAARLKARIASGALTAGRPGSVVLELCLDSGDVLRDARVRIRAPAGALASQVSQVLTIASGGTGPTALKFELTPSAKPYCPIEVLVDSGNNDDELMAPPIPLALEVV